MIIDPSQFQITRELQAIVETIKRECAAVPDEHFDNCPHTTLYTHGWLIFPILIQDWPYPCDFARNRAFTPVTYEVLSRFPQVICAAISRLHPGCRIFPHSDNPQPNALRGHLCLQPAQGVSMRIGGRVIQWEPDRFQVFDSAIEHEVHHDGNANRDILLVDFVTTSEERRALVAAGIGGRWS